MAEIENLTRRRMERLLTDVWRVSATDARDWVAAWCDRIGEARADGALAVAAQLTPDSLDGLIDIMTSIES
jgi:hypothetical protein